MGIGVQVLRVTEGAWRTARGFNFGETLQEGTPRHLRHARESASTASRAALLPFHRHGATAPERCRRDPSKHQAPEHQVWWLSSPTPIQVHEDLGRRALCFDGQRGPSHGRQQTLPGFPFIQTNSFPLNRDQRIRTSALAACVPPTGLAPYFGQASSLEVTRKNAREGTRTCIGLPQRPAYLHKHRHCLQEGKTQKAPLLPTHLTTL